MASQPQTQGIVAKSRWVWWLINRTAKKAAEDEGRPVLLAADADRCAAGRSEGPFEGRKRESLNFRIFYSHPKLMAVEEAEFSTLNLLLAGSDVSIDIIKRLAEAFPNLEKALDQRLAKDIIKLIEENRLDLLELAKARGVLDEGKDVTFFLFAAREFRDEIAAWFLTETGAAKKFRTFAVEYGMFTTRAAALYLRHVGLTKDNRMWLINLAIDKLMGRIFSLLDQIRYVEPTIKVDLQNYPLVGKYLEVTPRRPISGLVRIPSPKIFAELEAEIKAAVWILATADRIYPEENVLELFDVGGTPYSVIFRALVAEYKRAYQSK